jgi:hypothetical protein
MEPQESDLDGPYGDLADRFRALSHLFGALGSPRAAQDLIDGLLSDDPALFNQFADGLDLPMSGKCFWVREILERVLQSPSRLTKFCWLRDDLTPAQRLAYIRIAWRYRSTPVLATQSTLPAILKDGHEVIPSGPFLDELEANGLTQCGEYWTHESVIVPVLGPPERVCV